MTFFVQPEVKALLSEVEKKFGRTVKTSTDFEDLSDAICDSNAADKDSLISSSTLKRLWGYVNSLCKPRINTLSVLARYVGYYDYSAWSLHLQTESGFLQKDYLNADKLDKGAMVKLSWAPDRTVIFENTGGGLYTVVKSVNSKLVEGDKLRLGILLLHSEFYVNEIIRGGRRTSPYLAAKAGGLTAIEIL